MSNKTEHHQEPAKTSDKFETQRFAILNVLTSHCGQTLTSQVIDDIRKEINHEMMDGPCSWAFK